MRFPTLSSGKEAPFLNSCFILQCFFSTCDFLITSGPLKQCNKSHLSCRDSFNEECFQSAIVILQLGHPIVSEYQLKKNVAHFITLLCRTSGDAVTVTQLHFIA